MQRDPTARSRSGDIAVLRGLILSWMFLFGMIGAGLVVPNLLSIERELGVSHGQVGGVFALIQIPCSLAVLYAASRRSAFDNATAFAASHLVQTLGFVTVYASRGPTPVRDDAPP